MRNIVFLGLVSFFADASSEMVYPLIPLYLTAIFGATPALVGVIEGIAESLASLLKVFSGYLTDRFQRKKPLAFCGYATGVLYKLALLLAGSWAGILTARVIDRLGKGIRTAPRDVMVSESVEGRRMGGAFGVHKALDMAGSAVGILASYFLLRRLSGNADAYRLVFALSLIPAVLALGMFGFIRERREPRSVSRRPAFWRGLRGLDGRLKLYLAVSALFTLGNSSNTFLLLRAKSVGFTDTSVILLYFLYNLTASVLAIPLGRLSDRIGRKRLLVMGYGLFSLVYFGFAYASKSETLVVIFLLYGVYTAMTAGVERALIAEISPPQLKGTMLGLQSTIVGVCLLPASAIAGVLWTTLGAAAPFLYGSILSLAAALVLGVFLRPGLPDAV